MGCSAGLGQLLHTPGGGTAQPPVGPCHPIRVGIHRDALYMTVRAPMEEGGGRGPGVPYSSPYSRPHTRKHIILTTMYSVHSLIDPQGCGDLDLS